MDATPQGVNSKKPVSTAGLTTEINPAEEWNQIFGEVWRRYRDWFYVANMHGYDWAKLREQYKSWLPFVAHRSDFKLRHLGNDFRIGGSARLYRRRRF
jgi:tricorn protease